MASLVVVASDLTLRDAWCVALEARRHVVIVATTAAAAVAHLRAGGIDVVLVDYEVAGGIDLLVACIQRLPDAPPLLLVSGDAGAPAVSARVGAAALLLKPVNLDDLGAAVARATS